MRVFIVGSCVSRDALATVPEPQDLKLVSYHARSSLGVLASGPVAQPEEIATIAAPWCRRMVQADHAKTLLHAVAEASFDLLLLDLIDERFDLLETPDGVVTVSREYAEAVGRRPMGLVIPAFGTRHVALWRAGFALLTTTLHEQGRLDRLRVNRVFWASRTVSGEPLAGFDPARTRAANAFLRARYEDIARALGDAVFLDYSADVLRADPAHRWGLSPFHFGPQFYDAQLVSLRTAGSGAPEPDAAAICGPSMRAAPHDSAGREHPDFDYPAAARWPQRYSLREGVHRFALPAGHGLDLLLDGLDRLRLGNTILVYFGDAAAQRAEHTVRYSFGREIGQALGRPVLCISDPVVAQSSTLAMGWYAGYRGCSDLPQRIAALLDDLAARLAAHLVLFGGSSGGFGALAVLGHLRSPANALVWNAHATIGRANVHAVRAYVDAAFGDDREVSAGLKQSLEVSGVRHSLLDAPPRHRHPYLYLQNRSDAFHVEHHARPFAMAANVLRVGRAAFAGDCGAAFWFGDWDQGHMPPPPDILHLAIDRLSRGASTLAVALELMEGAGSDDPVDL
ncbi:MAG TPA: DUF6270 domain-containing protein [Burkholderiaceae bacterium]|nr:DUF6270 domain-containing protein [Burkholderiaceae bacterium]